MITIYTSGDKKYRIIEHLDEHFDMENLKGDLFNLKYNPEIEPEKLRQEEAEFEKQVEREGVYGFVLEKWNPEPNTGWEHIDSVWGFVGQYSPGVERFNHYIVEELKGQIK